MTPLSDADIRAKNIAGYSSALRIRAARTDLPLNLTHLLKYQNCETDTDRYSVMEEILSSKRLRASKQLNGCNAVCFREITDEALFDLIKGREAEERRSAGVNCYAPMGVFISIEYSRSQGISPVIPINPHQIQEMPQEERYRCQFYSDDLCYDWTHEREWRSPTDVHLDFSQTSLLLPSRHSLEFVPSARLPWRKVFFFDEIQQNPLTGVPSGDVRVPQESFPEIDSGNAQAEYQGLYQEHIEAWERLNGIVKLDLIILAAPWPVFAALLPTIFAKDSTALNALSRPQAIQTFLPGFLVFIALTFATIGFLSYLCATYGLQTRFDVLLYASWLNRLRATLIGKESAEFRSSHKNSERSLPTSDVIEECWSPYNLLNYFLNSLSAFYITLGLALLFIAWSIYKTFSWREVVVSPMTVIFWLWLNVLFILIHSIIRRSRCKRWGIGNS